MQDGNGGRRGTETSNMKICDDEEVAQQFYAKICAGDGARALGQFEVILNAGFALAMSIDLWHARCCISYARINITSTIEGGP